MATTIRANRRRLNGELSQVAFQMPAEHRRRMQAIAKHRRWPESEALREAVELYLRENSALLQTITVESETNGHDPAD